MVDLAFDERFDHVMKDFTYETAPPGEAVATLKVTTALSNSFGTLHGGAVCLLVDIISTLALLSQENPRPNVSVDLNVSFLAPALVGDVVRLHGRVLKEGGRLAYTHVDIFRVGDDAHIAAARHTKAFRPAKL